MSDTPIEHDIRFEPDGQGGGRYVILGLGAGEPPELVFRRRGDDAIVITHTGVPPALEGRGLGRALFDRAVADARRAGVKIEPRCAFAEAQFKRRADLADLLAS